MDRKPRMLTVSKLFVKTNNNATDPELPGGLGLLQHLAFPSTQSSVPLCGRWRPINPHASVSGSRSFIVTQLKALTRILSPLCRDSCAWQEATSTRDPPQMTGIPVSPQTLFHPTPWFLRKSEGSSPAGMHGVLESAAVSSGWRVRGKLGIKTLG